MKKTVWWVYAPVCVFFLLLLFLWRGLSINPHQLPSALLDKPAPVFRLPQLQHPNHVMTETIFQGKVSLFNVWASWCVACHTEHPVLMDIALQSKLPIYGLNYKDSRVKATNLLKRFGNPYTLIAYDDSGSAAINWGVYGTPETFVIDKQGIIRYKQLGPISEEDWQKRIKPLVKQLQAQS